MAQFCIQETVRANPDFCQGYRNLGLIHRIEEDIRRREQEKDTKHPDAGPTGAREALPVAEDSESDAKVPPAAPRAIPFRRASIIARTTSVGCSSPTPVA